MKNIVLLKWFPFLQIKFLGLAKYHAYFNNLFICIYKLLDNVYMFNSQYNKNKSNIFYENFYEIIILLI